MNWKVFSLVILIFLTLVVCLQNIISTHHDLILDANKWADSLQPSTYVDLDGLDFETKISVVQYIEGSANLYWAVIVSTDWCPIREWAEAMFVNHSGYLGRSDSARFDVNYGDNYYAVYLLKKELYSYNFIVLLNLLTACLWITFAYYTYKETRNEE